MSILYRGWCCEISIDRTILSSANGLTQKEARFNAATEGLKVLRKSCFTIQVNSYFLAQNHSKSSNVQTFSMGINSENKRVCLIEKNISNCLNICFKDVCKHNSSNFNLYCHIHNKYILIGQGQCI